jgi:hypothetical protein
LSKIEIYFTVFSLKYYHDIGLVCSTGGKNDKSINNLYWWTLRKEAFRKQVDGKIMDIWKMGCANEQYRTSREISS